MPRYLVERTFPDGLEIPMTEEGSATCLTVVDNNAEEGVTLTQGRFDVGLATTVELTDSRQALAQARADDVQARADLDTASSRLVRALGSTAAREEPVPEEKR